MARDRVAELEEIARLGMEFMSARRAVDKLKEQNLSYRHIQWWSKREEFYKALDQFAESESEREQPGIPEGPRCPSCGLREGDPILDPFQADCDNDFHQSSELS